MKHLVLGRDFSFNPVLGRFFFRNPVLERFFSFNPVLGRDFFKHPVLGRFFLSIPSLDVFCFKNLVLGRDFWSRKGFSNTFLVTKRVAVGAVGEIPFFFAGKSAMAMPFLKLNRVWLATFGCF